MAEVLIVDDDDDLAEITALALEGAGHRTRRAGDGIEGLGRLRERLPDAVVLDVEMPLLDGPGVALERLIEDAGMEQVPIVLVSGCVDLAAAAAAVGTPYVLAKPYSLGELLAMIDRAVRGERAAAPRA